MAKYRGATGEVEAVRWTGENLDEMVALIREALPADVCPILVGVNIVLMTSATPYRIMRDHWFVLDANAGKFYVYGPGAFAETYEPIA